MSNLPQLDIKLDGIGNDFIFEANEFIKFSIIVKHLGSEHLPRIFLTLLTPPEIWIAKKTKSIVLTGGEQRSVPFRIKSKAYGLFALTAIAKLKNSEIAKIPITLRVEAQQQQSLIRPQHQVVSSNTDSQQMQIPMKTSKFCPFCGSNLNPKAKFCENCGSDVT